MANDAVISIEGKNLRRQESCLSFPQMMVISFSMDSFLPVGIAVPSAIEKRKAD